MVSRFVRRVRTASGSVAVQVVTRQGRTGGSVLVPFYGRRLPARMRACNSSHAKVRAIGERGNTTLKTWRVLTKLRCCPRRATTLVAAILALELNTRS